jgi:nucleotide-binding universal stress UspA family protein
MSSAPVVIGFDGTAAARRAVRDAGALLAPRPALVVVVWEAGRAFDLTMLPATGFGPRPATMDVRAGVEIDRAVHDQALRTAELGESLAGAAGFDATSTVVADTLTVADTLVRIAREHASPAIVVGAHAKGAVSELILGSTSRDVIRHAPCPVLVIREHGDDAG